MEYKMADTGLPSSVVFDRTSFVRPKSSKKIGDFVLSDDRETNSATYDTTITADTVIESQVNGCLTRVVKDATSQWQVPTDRPICEVVNVNATSSPSLHGDILLINIPPNVWRPKMVNNYSPVDAPDDIEDGIFDYKQYRKRVLRPVDKWKDIERDCYIIYNHSKDE